MTSRLVIVEDHGLIAETVGTVLRARGFEVHLIDALATQDLHQATISQDPDLVLLDLDLGRGRDAMDVLPDLREQGVTVLIVTGVTDPVRHAQCIRGGAIGIVDKGAAFGQLIDAIVEALEHGTLLTSHEREEHLALLREHEASQRERLAPFSQLTPREAAVLRGLCRGQSVDEIAADAVVSVFTIRTQVRAILRKLGVNSQLAATALARDAGWMGRDH